MLSVAASTQTGTRVVSAEEMEALAVGAWILGTGGGGDPYQKLLNMRQLYKKGYRASLLDPMYLNEDDRVAVVSGMGAPLVGQERLADPHFAVKPVRMMEEYCGQRFRAIMALEIGGGNGLQPFMVAALMGLPVVDADSMGRAYPEAQMTSFAVRGLPMYPLAVADIRDNEVIVTRAASATWVERLSRKVVVEMGSTAATCKTAQRRRGQGTRHPLHRQQGHTAGRGGAARAAPTRRRDRRGAAGIRRQAHVQRQGRGRGTPHHGGLPARPRRARRAGRGSRLALHAAFPERVLGGRARRRARGHDAGPDLRADSVSGDGIGTDVLRFGQRVSVLALPAPQVPANAASNWSARARLDSTSTIAPSSREAIAMKHIGIDVGGTNTDAVFVQDNQVLGAVKSPTTSDVTTGVRRALAALIQACPQAAAPEAVMIGTTHFTNAVVQRRDLEPAAALRVCLPAAASLLPFCDWPEDLAQKVNGGTYLVQGGHEFDGRELMPLDERAVRDAARAIRASGVSTVAISGVFSPLIGDAELRAGEILKQEHPDCRITYSHQLGRIGLLGRENVALLNATLIDLAHKTTDAFVQALADSGIDAPLFLTQNDGTVTLAENARDFPVHSFASGPTNSMRGAVFLAKINDAVVCDVGGTTADVGCVQNGFPGRQTIWSRWAACARPSACRTCCPSAWAAARW